MGDGITTFSLENNFRKFKKKVKLTPSMPGGHIAKGGGGSVQPPDCQLKLQMEVSRQLYSLAAVFPGENAVTLCIGNVMGPERSGRFLGEQNILPVPKFEPRTVQLVAQSLYRLHYLGSQEQIFIIIRKSNPEAVSVPYALSFFKEIFQPKFFIFFKVGLRDHHALCVHACVLLCHFELLNWCIDLYETCYQYCGTGSSAPYI